jgi:hypothetical protein
MPLSNLRGSIPLPYAVVFLTVALEEGKTMSAYARALGIDNRRTMSRYLADAIIQQMRIAVAPEARRSTQRPRSLFLFALWLLRRRPRRHKRK